MRPIRAFEIYDDDDGRTLYVFVFPTTRCLNAFARRTGSFNHYFDRGVSLGAFYMSYVRDVRKPGTYGCVAFAEDRIGGGIVAHEMFHAVHDLFKSRYPSARYRDRRDIEELQAIELEGLVRSFWDWWYKDCPKRYRVKFTADGKRHMLLPANDAAKP